MTFEELERRLGAALREPLPGAAAQERMLVRPRSGRPPWREGSAARDAAALLLLFPDRGGASVVLTLRRGDLARHAGQVSLPGGAVEPGETIAAAAFREAREEVGLDDPSVRVLGRLSPLPIAASGFVLHPVVAVAERRPALRAADAEVERILEAPLDRLLDPASLRVEAWRLSRGECLVPFFSTEGEKVWGATAMVLAELLGLLGSAPEPFERSHPPGVGLPGDGQGPEREGP